MKINKFLLSLYRNKPKTRMAFIFGCPRSGTTYLWSLIESSADAKPFLNGKHKDENNNYPSSESGVYINNPKNAKKLIETFIKNNDVKLVFEKTPMHTLRYSTILGDFPGAEVILIFRNPIAIVNSIIQSKMEIFAKETLHSSVQIVKNYYAHLECLTKKKNVIILKYEDLLSDPTAVVTNLFNKLRLDVVHVESIIKENLNTSKININGVFRKGQVDSHKRDLPEDSFNFIRKELIQELIFFNSIFTKIN